MSRREEMWRLCNPRGWLAVCTVDVIPSHSGRYVLEVRVGHEVVIAEDFRAVHDAHDRADVLRQHYVSTGWTGEFPYK